jgi:hypothetical protein
MTSFDLAFDKTFGKLKRISGLRMKSRQGQKDEVDPQRDTDIPVCVRSQARRHGLILKDIRSRLCISTASPGARPLMPIRRYELR